MKYNMLANIKAEQGKIRDMFSLGSLDPDKLTITVKQIWEMLDNFAYNVAASQAYVQAHLLNYLFVNMGGNDKTPVQDIMAFMYVALQTPAFQLQKFYKEIIVAINFNNMCIYFQENDIEVPGEFMTNTAGLLNNENLYNIIVERYTFNVYVGMAKEKIDAFYKKLTEEIIPYMESTSKLDNMLGNLNIGMNGPPASNISGSNTGGKK